MRHSLIAIALIAPVGCTAPTPAPSVAETELQVQTVADLRRGLLEIAANYKGYEKTDNRMRVAQVACAMPTLPKSEYRFSRSDDANSHGKKLYQMYAAKIDPITGSYTPGNLQTKTGQVIVKESWLADAAKEDDYFSKTISGANGQRFKPGAKGPLFAMFQVDAKDPRSDEGWVYGTLTPDGKTITGIGRIANCMACHQKAPHGRLFGLPRD